MFVIPLGLGTKIRWTPWISAAILLTWLSNFFIDPFRENISDQLSMAASKSGIKDAARKLFIDYCMHRKGNIPQCEELSNLIWTGFPGKNGVLPKHKDKSLILDKVLEKEFESASRLRESLRDCSLAKKPQRCIHYKEIFWKFLQLTDNLLPKKKQDIISHLPSYGSYVSALSDFHTRMLAICKYQDCLTKNNIKPSSILLAQMRHGGLLHLVSNVIVFLVFAVYVEQKMKPHLFFLGLLLSGSMGMLVHAKIWGTQDTFIIGGSTVVSGVIGIFFSLFFHRKICLRVLIPRKFYLGSNLYISSKYAIPFLFIMTDIAGGFNSGYNELGISQVAHFAHLTSFLCGCILGLGIVLTDKKVPRELYREEEQDAKRVISAPLNFKTLKKAAYFLEIDPTHEQAMLVGLRCYFANIYKASANKASKEVSMAKNFAKKYTAYFIHQVLKSRETRLQENSSLVTSEHLVRLFDLIPPQADLKEHLKEIEAQTLLHLALLFVTKEASGLHGAYYHSLRVLDLFLLQFPKSNMVSTVNKLMSEILARFVFAQEKSNFEVPYLAHLKVYATTHHHSTLRKILEASWGQDFLEFKVS